MNMIDFDLLVDFVDLLISKYGFSKYYHDKGADLYDFLEDSGVREVARYCDGASKGVFIPYDSDWVIKYNLPGEHNDYCGREFSNYLDAKACGLEHYFAETVYLTEVDGICFYAQRKVSIDYGAEEVITDSFVERQNSSGYPVSRAEAYDIVQDMDSADRIEMLFGDIELINFVINHRINDLHGGTIGTLNGTFVLLDYSGYGSQVFEI